MKKIKPDINFAKLVKSLLKEAGFSCRGKKCTARGGVLRVELSFRNRWGTPVPDIYIEVYDAKVGNLLQGDIRHLFQEFYDLRAEFSDEELLSLDAYTEIRVRSVVAKEVVPQALALSGRDHFLEQLDAGCFAKAGVYADAVAKLRTENN